MKFFLSIISAIIVITTVIPSAFAGTGSIFSGEEDTLYLYNQLSSEIMRDTSGVIHTEI
jgi:hypothetical protein